VRHGRNQDACDGIFDKDRVTVQINPYVLVDAISTGVIENALDQFEELRLFWCQDRPARYCPEFPRLKAWYIA